jgi:hypothetical protein
MEKIGGTGVREAVIKDISLQLQSRKFKNSHPTTAKSASLTWVVMNTNLPATLWYSYLLMPTYNCTWRIMTSLSFCH